MDIIVPISEARGKLPGLIKKMVRLGKRLVITKNGRAEAVVMSPEQVETLEIMADPELMASIRRGLEDAKAGRVYSFEDVFKRKSKKEQRHSKNGKRSDYLTAAG